MTTFLLIVVIILVVIDTWRTVHIIQWILDRIDTIEDELFEPLDFQEDDKKIDEMLLLAQKHANKTNKKIKLPKTLEKSFSKARTPQVLASKGAGKKIKKAK